MEYYFKQDDFTIFKIEGLEERMTVIRERIQPVFQSVGDTFIKKVNDHTKFEGEFHIAQHRRRTTNPPESTWAAFGGNKRGYKKYPHIQLGINDDHIFMFLSIIDNPKHEKVMGHYLLENKTAFSHLTDDFFISGDHTRTDIQPISPEVIENTLNRLINVKKGEFMIGRVLTQDSEELGNKNVQHTFFEETLDKILPIYTQLLEVYFNHENKLQIGSV